MPPNGTLIRQIFFKAVRCCNFLQTVYNEWVTLTYWQTYLLEIPHNLATLGSCVSRNLEHLQVGSHVLLTNVLGKASEVHVPTFRDWSLQGRSLTQYHKFGQFDQAIPIHILTKPWRSPDSCRDFCKESTRSQDELLFLPQVSST